MNQTPQENSEFNYGISWLQRIDEQFRIANYASSQRDAGLWMRALTIIYREISTEIPKDQREPTEQTFRLIQTQVNQWEYRQKRNPSLPAYLYNNLHQFDKALRQLMNEAGMITRRKEKERMI